MKPFNLSIHSFLFLFLMFPFCVIAQQPDWRWGIRGGSSTSDQNGNLIREAVDDMAVDAQGNTYIVSEVGGGIGLQGPTLIGALAFLWAARSLHSAAVGELRPREELPLIQAHQ